MILGHAAVDLVTGYYVVAHSHFVLSLGAIISVFSGQIFNGEKIVDSKFFICFYPLVHSLFHLHSIFLGILLTFSPCIS